MVCADEAGKQLIGEVRPPLPVRVGSPAKQDGEYVRNGTANLFMAFEPLAGGRVVVVTARRTAIDFAKFLKRPLDDVSPVETRVVGLGTATQWAAVKADWQFTTTDARVRLKKLYPTVQL